MKPVTAAASSPSTDSPGAIRDATSPSQDLVPSPLRSPVESASVLREKRRLIEQRSRQKRKQQLASMPAKVAQLERTAFVMRLVSDPDAVWDEFLDDETKRTRDNVRRLVAAFNDAQQLTQEKAQLEQFQKEQQLVVTAVTTELRRMETADEWEVNERRWRALAKRHFHPLTPTQCAHHMKFALIKVDQFMKSYNRTSSGLSFLGWRDSRRILPRDALLQFSFDKTYRGFDVDAHINLVWRVFTERDLYCRLVLGGRARVSVEVLQELSPTALVIRISESYDGLPLTFHEVFLLFRTETENCIIQYVACLPDTALDKVIRSPSDVWNSNFYWVKWDLLDPSQDRTAADYKVSIGGCLRGRDLGFLRRWMCELLHAIIRIESLANSRPMLQF